VAPPIEHQQPDFALDESTTATRISA